MDEDEFKMDGDAFQLPEEVEDEAMSLEDEEDDAEEDPLSMDGFHEEGADEPETDF
jgi:hypothetical protein